MIDSMERRPEPSRRRPGRRDRRDVYLVIGVMMMMMMMIMMMIMMMTLIMRMIMIKTRPSG